MYWYYHERSRKYLPFFQNYNIYAIREANKIIIIVNIIQNFS